MSNIQVLLPCFVVQIEVPIGTRSPTFQPYFLRQLAADERAGARLLHRLEILGLDLHLAVDLEQRLGVGRERRGWRSSRSGNSRRSTSSARPRARPARS
jgi:hypothetical protein